MPIFHTWIRRIPAGIVEVENYGPVEIPEEVLQLPMGQRIVEIMGWSWHGRSGMWDVQADGYKLTEPVFDPSTDCWTFVAEGRYASYNMGIVGNINLDGPW